MARTVLVTGACGFVGSNLVRTGLEQGCDVRATDLPSCPRERLDGLDVEFIPSDVTKAETLTEIVKGVDHVFHPAAVFNYSAPWKLFKSVNIDGTENMCKAAVETGGIKKFVLISTVEIYGITPPELLPTREDAPKKPLSPYAKSKLAQEEVAMRFYEDHGLPVIRPIVTLS